MKFNVLYSTFTNVFYSCYVFCVFNVFLILISTFFFTSMVLGRGAAGCSSQVKELTSTNPDARSMIGFGIIMSSRLSVCPSVTLCIVTNYKMPCYRREDRAMRPMYGCPENFRESLSTTTATFTEIFNRIL